MLITLSRRVAICQSVAEVQLTGVTPLGAVSHRFNFFIIPSKTGKALFISKRNYRNMTHCHITLTPLTYVIFLKANCSVISYHNRLAICEVFTTYSRCQCSAKCQSVNVFYSHSGKFAFYNALIKSTTCILLYLWLLDLSHKCIVIKRVSIKSAITYKITLTLSPVHIAIV